MDIKVYLELYVYIYMELYIDVRDRVTRDTESGGDDDEM